MYAVCSMCVCLVMDLSIYWLIWQFQLHIKLAPYLVPLTNIALTGSVYTVMAIAVERYTTITRSCLKVRRKGYLVPAKALLHIKTTVLVTYYTLSIKDLYISVVFNVQIVFTSVLCSQNLDMKAIRKSISNVRKKVSLFYHSLDKAKTFGEQETLHEFKN